MTETSPRPSGDPLPTWLTGGWSDLGTVAAKAALIYLVALLGLRVAHRRTLSQWTAIDFAAAVAIGAVLGRTAVATGQSFVVGAVALVSILAAHSVVTMARYNRWAGKAVDHRVRVLVDHGRIRPDQLRICGLTEHDVIAQLRQRGAMDLDELRYVLYEAKGELTIVVDRPGEPDPALVRSGLCHAAGFGHAGTRDPDAG